MSESRHQSGLHHADDWGDVDPHLQRRHQRLAIQLFGGISAFYAGALGPKDAPSLATCEHLSIPDAVPDFSNGGLSAPSDIDILDVAFRLGIEDTDRAAQLALRSSHSTDARAALMAALELDDLERRRTVVELLEHDKVVEAKNYALCEKQSVRLVCPDEFGAGGCGYKENYVPVSCDSRLCYDCMKRQMGEKIERYESEVRSWSDPTFYTLTLENSQKPVRDTEAVVGAFGRFRQRKIPPNGPSWHWHEENGDDPATGWKAKLRRAGKHDLARRLQKRYVEQGKWIPVKEVLKGGIYSVDVKQKRDDWNIHLHVLADAHWIPQAAISHIWDDLTGSPVVDVRRIYNRGDNTAKGALLETVAYACKPPEFEEIEDAVEYISATKNRRFVQTFGETHGNVDDLDGHLLCARCENTPAWWNYDGLVAETRDNMGSTHSADSTDPP